MGVDCLQSTIIRYEKKHITMLVSGLILFGALIRIVAMYHKPHYFDLSYYVDWSTGVVGDLFGAYENIPNLDYPPMFLFPLYLVGLILKNTSALSFDPYAMLALKFWQVFFDVALIWLIYFVAKRRDEIFAVFAAALWAINPSMIFDSAYWGQTDAIMIFLLLLSYHLLESKRPVCATVVFVIGCLTKFQTLYFAPVFGLVLLTDYNWKKFLQCAGAGAGTFFGVFTPFMLRSGIDLPIRVYFGGLDMYQMASFNAANFFSAIGLNQLEDTTPVLGLITAGNLGNLFLMLAVIFLIIIFFTAKNRCIWTMAFLFMQTVYMLSARMHERYQIPVLLFALMAYLIHRDSRMLGSFFALTITTLLNQFFVLNWYISPGSPWISSFQTIILILGLINFALFLFTVYVSLDILYDYQGLGKNHLESAI